MQMKNHKEKKGKKSKAKASLLVVVSKDISIIFMIFDSTFKIWNFLKGEYEGDHTNKGIRMPKFDSRILDVKNKGV